MIEQRVALHLVSMRSAARNAVTLVVRMSYEDFVDDPHAQAATAMYLIVIGEAAAKISQLSPGFIDSHPEMPWERMRGLRNRIVHDYETLHLPTVWATATESLPALLSQIESFGKLDLPGLD